MTLTDFFSILKKHIKLVIILPLLCGIACGIFCWGLLPNQYTASVSVYAIASADQADANSKNTNSSNTSSSQYSSLNSGQLLANDFAKIADNDQIKAKTAESLGLKNLDGYTVKVTNDAKSRVLKIDVTGKDPQMATDIANKLAEDVSARAEEVMGMKAFNILSSAETPTSPSGPPRTMYTLVALLAGLFLAILIAVLIEILNTKITSEKDVTEYLGVQVIGRFPLNKGGRR